MRLEAPNGPLSADGQLWLEHDVYSAPFYGVGTYDGSQVGSGATNFPGPSGWFDGNSADQVPHFPEGLDLGETSWHTQTQFPRFSFPVTDTEQTADARQPPGRRAVRHRRQRLRPASEHNWPRLLSTLFGTLTAFTVATVSVLGWMFSYDPLQDLASLRVSQGLAQLWPLVVYGPWLVASLSILRATIARDRATYSWVVVVLSSAVATVLCVVSASKTLPGVVVAGLPPLTAVVSFHQLIRQLITPLHARPTVSGRGGMHKAR